MLESKHLEQVFFLNIMTLPSGINSDLVYEQNDKVIKQDNEEYQSYSVLSPLKDLINFIHQKAR